MFAVAGMFAGAPGLVNVTSCVTLEKAHVMVPVRAISMVAGAKVEEIVALTVALSGYTGAVTVTPTEAFTRPDVALMFAEPAATPVTSPLLLTVATLVAFDDQLIVAAIGSPF